MHKPAPAAPSGEGGDPAAAAATRMRREVAAAMRNPSIMEPNFYPVLDILIEADGLRVEAGGGAEVDVASLPADTCAELHDLLLAPQKMPPGPKSGAVAAPVRRRGAAANPGAGAVAAAPPQGTAAAKGAPKPGRSFESLLRDALVHEIHDDDLLAAALVDVIDIASQAGVLTQDTDGEPVLDIDTLAIPTMLKLYGALMRARKNGAGAV